eukprot:NODE_736_length_2794_cov_14.258343.p1 GENE.NODE_736_length_2794_cov_14.258343~~NODE_736_length_2794_cov_14.258343.p1  ORF type:complete len:836 (+),score=217.18 NODE_736_length_2794_cov_14.258343:89-2596(+)
MDIRFRKGMAFDNSRLAVLGCLLRLIFLVALIVQLIVMEDYLITVDTSQMMEVVIWGEADTSETSDVDELDVDEALCDDVSIWDYCFDEACGWEYAVKACLPMCGDGVELENCASWSESFHETELSDAVTFATLVMESFVALEAGVDDASLPNDTNYFIRNTHRRRIGIIYSKFVQPYQLFYEQESHSSMNDFLSVFVDGAGNILEVAEPSNAIYMTWQDMLTSAGQPNLMNTLLPAAGTNRKPGHEAVGPIVRIPGIEVFLAIDCTNLASHNYMDVDIDWDGHICVIHADIPEVPRTWLSYNRIYPYLGGAALRKRIYHGLRVTASQDSNDFFFDFYELYVWFVSFLVVMRIPRQMLEFFATRALGELSTIYRRALYERFHLANEMAAVPVELMNSAACFYEIISKRAGMSKVVFTEWMVDALKSQPSLDEGEIARLTEQCFNEVIAVVTSAKEAGTLANEPLYLQGAEVIATLRALTEMAMPWPSGGLPEDEAEREQLIDIGDYLHIAMMRSRVCLPDLVALFNSERRVSCLERFFMPNTFRDAKPPKDQHTAVVRGIMQELRKDFRYHHWRHCARSAQLRSEHLTRESDWGGASRSGGGNDDNRSGIEEVLWGEEIENMRAEFQNLRDMTCSAMQQMRAELRELGPLRELSSKLQVEVFGSASEQDRKTLGADASLRERVGAIETVLESQCARFDEVLATSRSTTVKPIGRSLSANRKNLQDVESISDVDFAAGPNLGSRMRRTPLGRASGRLGRSELGTAGAGQGSGAGGGVDVGSQRPLGIRQAAALGPGVAHSPDSLLPPATSGGGQRVGPGLVSWSDGEEGGDRVFAA